MPTLARPRFRLCLPALALLLATACGGKGGAGGGTPAPAPAADPFLLTSFTPESGPPGTAVTLRGSNLGGATQVSFGGVPAAAFRDADANTIVAEVPALAATGLITVQAPAGLFTTATGFIVVNLPPPGPDDPSLVTFSPQSGPVGTEVSLQGSGLTGVTRVLFGGVPPASFSVVSDTSLLATVPAGAATGPITVINPSGQGSSATTFTVTP